MKKYFLTALLALPLLAATARADGGIFPPHIDAGVNLTWHLNCGNPGGGCQLGPWYHYWPLEAHFVTPAQPNYPYWPQPQTLTPPVNPMLPPPKADARPSAGPDVKPVGYYYYSNQPSQPAIRYGPAPSYWTPRP